MEKSLIVIKSDNESITYVTGIVETRTKSELQLEIARIEEELALIDSSSSGASEINDLYAEKMEALAAEKALALENYLKSTSDNMEAKSQLEETLRDLKAAYSAFESFEEAIVVSSETPATPEGLEGVNS